jgi:hypothetical protein
MDPARSSQRARGLGGLRVRKLERAKSVSSDTVTVRQGKDPGGVA